CYLRNVVIEIAVLNILSDAHPITTNGQTTTGKEYSNLFMAGSLLKTMMLSHQRICFHMSPFEFTFVYLVITSMKMLNSGIDSPLLGVNTPRSDEDRLKLMELMVFYLQKDVCVEIGITAARLSSYFCQANISDVWLLCDVTRLQALVDKKKIVISEVVIREILQLDDAKGVVCLPNEEISAGLAQMGYETSWNEFSTAVASAVICLSKCQKFNFSKYIFDSLVRNVDSSSKFYMYPRFIQLIIQNQVGDLSTHTTRFIFPFLTQKVFGNIRRVGKGFLSVQTPLFEGMLAARQLAEEEVAEAQVQADNAVAADVEENVTEDDPHDAIPSPPSHDIPSPSQEQPSPPQQPQSSPHAPPQGGDLPTHIQQILDVCFALTRRVENLENDKAAQKLEIVKLKARVKKLEMANKVKSSKLRRLRKVGASRRIESSDDMEDVFNQGRMIDDIDKDEGIELVKDADIAKTEGMHAVQQAKKQVEIYNLDLDHSSKVLSIQEDDLEVQEVVEVVTTAAASATIPAAAPTVVAAYTRRRKGVIIKDPEEELSSKTPAKTPKVKDKGKGILVETPKPMKKKDQIELDAEYARKLHEEINRDHEEFNKDIDWDAAMDHTESEAHKNMMIYLKNTVGYKMDFFKGMTYAQICPIFQARFDDNMRFLFKSREEMEEEDQKIIKSKNKTPVQKAAKRRKLSEESQEAEDLRKRLEVVDDEDDDVFIEATPLARKVPVMDYQIVLVDNKPRFKIIKADETHQLYVSFTTLLNNFNREDLENLWGIVKDTRCYMEKSKECSWFGIGKKLEAADFMWCSYHYSFNCLALSIG
nr:hypothetical protein [Tanacetum cinerariifolium]